MAGGRYVLGELLGRGGMGEVFAGFAYGSHGFQKPVAIKRLVAELANDDTYVRRLIGEAKVLVTMQHSNIVSVLDLTREGDDVFLVMEFVDGPSLHQLLKARGDRSLPFGIASYVIQAAATGLQFAHERRGGGIIHADISPGNLLLSTAGEVRVADFGIAQREGRASGIEGKWAYMAPEQLRGEALTRRCDVFALGVVLYELVTGRHPFGAHVTHAGRVDNPHHVVPPRDLDPNIPAGLEAVCLRTLAEQPSDRFATMAELIEALTDQRFAHGWREGAVDLALAIREVSAFAQREPPGTQVTGRPVTMMTASLIGRPTPTPDALEDARAAALDLAPTGLFEVPADLVATGETTPAPLAPTSMPLAPPPIHVEPLPERRRSRSILIGAGGVAVVALGIVLAIATRDEGSAESRTAVVPAPTPTIDANPLAVALMTIDAAVEPTITLDAAAPDAPPAEDIAIDPPATHQKKKHPTPPPPPPPPPPTAAGWLKVTTADGAWAKASVRAESFDIPGASFKLVPGSNRVSVKDATTTRTCNVEWKPGSQTLTVSMKTGTCAVR